MFTHTNTIQPLSLETIQNPRGRFYITPNGNKYPSITTILSAKENKKLQEWRESLGDKAADKETKRAAQRGEAVHKMVELFLQNHSDPCSDASTQVPIAVDHVGEFNVVKRYLKKHINNIVLQEAALYSDALKIAGRVDCVAEWDGVLSIIDFKTSTNTKHESIIGDYFLQTTAYALMFEELYDKPIDQLVIIMSVEKGIAPLIFKKPMLDYVNPLVERINTYYKEKSNG